MGQGRLKNRKEVALKECDWTPLNYKHFYTFLLNFLDKKVVFYGLYICFVKKIK